ncbi:transposase [Viscerimonas tarda]
MNKFNPEIHHRRAIRLQEYDYSQEGLYFVTICVQDKQCLFGEIVDGEMVLNDVGKIVYDEWMKTPIIRPEIELGEFVVMPNHFHAIIVITRRRGESHSPNNDVDNVGAYRIRPITANIPDTHIASNTQNVHNPNQGVFDTPLRSPSNTIGSIVRGYKSAVSKQLGFSVWQRNYHEHIIRNNQSYQKIAGYIINNPTNWADDGFYP